MAAVRFLSEADQRRLMIACRTCGCRAIARTCLDHKTDHGVKADEMAELLGARS